MTSAAGTSRRIDFGRARGWDRSVIDDAAVARNNQTDWALSYLEAATELAERGAATGTDDAAGAGAADAKEQR